MLAPHPQPRVNQVELHLISVDDDIDELEAKCSLCGRLYKGPDRNRKLAAVHFHLYEVHEHAADEGAA